jgi:hypothetical protein
VQGKRVQFENGYPIEFSEVHGISPYMALPCRVTNSTAREAEEDYLSQMYYACFELVLTAQVRPPSQVDN